MINLLDSERKVFSQNGEDGVIKEILYRIGLKNLCKNVVEFGTETGVEICSRLLIDNCGFNALLIEAGKEKFNLLQHKYMHNTKVVCYNEYVSVNNINGLISSVFPNDIDIIIIDIDGIDYQIFNAINNRPKLFIVEYNASLPFNLSLVNLSAVWDGTANFGASIKALEKIANKKGYSLIHTDKRGVNAFFIRNDFLNLFPEADSPAIHKPSYGNNGHPGLDINTFVEF